MEDINTSSSIIKLINIEYEGIIYMCKIELKEEEIININIYLDNKLKYLGNIFLEKIQIQIKAFLDYNINEIFEEINKLDNNNFSIIKENNKYKLKIKFIILRRKKYLYINLNSNNNNNEYYENIIKEKDKIIYEFNKKLLEEQLKNKRNNLNSNLDNCPNNIHNYNISLKNANPIHSLNYQRDYLLCLSILNDGRLISGSENNSIIIYNTITYQPDLIINEHKGPVFCITQLYSGILATCSEDKTMKLFNIKGNNYNIIQTLNEHTGSVNLVKEIENKYLVSCSSDKSIIFYLKDNDKYKKYYQISTNDACYCISQIKGNEICYSEYNDKIYFFDIIERKIKLSISNISKSYYSPFIMISKDLLFISGFNKISIININYYELIREIKIPNSGWIKGACMLNKNILLTGDDKGMIKEWKIEEDNLILISIKKTSHINSIYTLLNIGNGHFASVSDDKLIKIW